MFALALVLGSTTPEQFKADLLATPSATAILQRQCGARGKIVADKQRGRAHKIPRRLALALKLTPAETISYRRVRLICGSTIFSEADNWFVPTRLPVEMAAQLASGDAPFGRVVQPLKPYRQTLSTKARGGSKHVPKRFLVIEAIVLSGEAKPISAVIETYRREALSGSE